MEPIILLLFCGVILFILIFSGVNYYKQAQANLTEQIATLQAPYEAVSDQIFTAEIFETEALTSIKHADLAHKLEQRVHTLPFPELGPINAIESSSSIFEKLGKSFNTDAPVFAGVEQIVLTVIPTEYLASCIGFAAQSAGSHASAVMQEIAPILKQSVVDGWLNLSNLSTVKQCLSSFFTSYVSEFGPAQPLEFGQSMSLMEAVTKLLPDHHQNLLGGLTVATNTLDPAFQLSQHGSQIKQVAFSHAKQVAQATQAHASTVAVRSVGARIPYVTIILSTVREVKLLSDNKTSFDSSLKNIALDAVGAGGGAYAGAQAGAFIGTFVAGPAGTALGGIIGGIVGGIGGKLATDSIKQIAYKEAVADLNNTHITMLTSLRTVAVKAYESTQEVVKTVKGQYKTSLKALSSPKKHAQDSIGYIYSLKAGLQSDLQNSLSIIAEIKSSFFFAFSSAKHELITLENELKQALHKLTDLSDPDDLVQNITNFPYPIDGQFIALLPTVTQMLKQRNDMFMPNLMAYSHDAAQLYQGAYNNVVQTLNDHAIHYEKETNRWKSTLDAKQQAVKKEAEKLGKKIN